MVKKTEPDACWEEEGDEKEREPIVGELWDAGEMYGWFGRSCCWRCMRARPVSVFCLVPMKKMCVSKDENGCQRERGNISTPITFLFGVDLLSVTLDCCSFSGVQGCNAFLPWLPQTYRFLASVKKTGGSFQSACLAMERTHGLSPPRIQTRSSNIYLFALNAQWQSSLMRSLGWTKRGVSIKSSYDICKTQKYIMIL